jgi:hypothetical protein
MGPFFAGWNTEAVGGGTDYSADQQFSLPAAPLNLYFQWTEVGTFISMPST